MSVAQLLTGAADPAEAPRRRTVLTVVPVRAAAETRTSFAAGVVALLVTGLVGLLVLNTVLGKDSFHLHDLRVQAVELADTEQRLVREVEALRAPGTLAQKATEMGMVQAGPPAFLRLSDGAVLGATDPAAPPVLAPAEADPVAEQDAPTAESDGAADEETDTATDETDAETVDAG
jgi:hypothetical protein